MNINRRKSIHLAGLSTLLATLPSFATQAQNTRAAALFIHP